MYGYVSYEQLQVTGDDRLCSLPMRETRKSWAKGGEVMRTAQRSIWQYEERNDRLHENEKATAEEKDISDKRHSA